MGKEVSDTKKIKKKNPKNKRFDLLGLLHVGFSVVGGFCRFFLVFTQQKAAGYRGQLCLIFFSPGKHPLGTSAESVGSKHKGKEQISWKETEATTAWILLEANKRYSKRAR